MNNFKIKLKMLKNIFILCEDIKSKVLNKKDREYKN